MKPPLLIVVTILGLAAALTACGEGEEITPAATTGSVTGVSSTTASPSPFPSKAPTPAGGDQGPDWLEYKDDEAGFSISRPAALSLAGEDTVTLTGGGKFAEATMRILTFRSTTGTRALDIGIVKNPNALSAGEWLDAYDPCASDSDPSLPQRTSAVVGDFSGITCPVDQLNQANPRVYITADGYVLIFVGNVNGLPESNQPPGLTQAEFDSTLASFRFPG